MSERQFEPSDDQYEPVTTHRTHMRQLDNTPVSVLDQAIAMRERLLNGGTVVEYFKSNIEIRNVRPDSNTEAFT